MRCTGGSAGIVLHDERHLLEPEDNNGKPLTGEQSL